MNENRSEPRLLDALALRAIAHPLRLRMLAILSAEGPSTATLLAERLGESSGLTSYHLRQLAEHDFIEEDEERGTKRERWWRPRNRGMRLLTREMSDADHPATKEAMDVYLQEVIAYQFQSVQDAVLNRHLRTEEWDDTLFLNDAPLTLTAEQLRELMETIERYDSMEPEEGAERVLVLLDAFPQATLPYRGVSDEDEA